MLKKSLFMEAFEQPGAVLAMPQNPSGSSVAVVLSRKAPLDRPVDVVRTLVWNGLRLSKAHAILARLTKDEDVPVLLTAAEPFNELAKKFRALGVSVHKRTAPRHVSQTLRQLRERRRDTQEEFAIRYGLDVSTIRNWEQQRSEPDTASRILLQVIAKHPEVVESVLEEEGG
ncbi:helix-turn-helix domain-containing protein [Shumkonia mesophila]|uniref:helix-turn-helix domain-containing protein n=1 Tax=Shumkonia mesophila TaxID=2838854 RepID=UPI002934BB0A|nr:helix-turn-helix domain-containing protein [Shumkonia mesophila]